MITDPVGGREYLSSSQSGKSIEEVRAKALAPQSEGTDADGGYLVPEAMDTRIYGIVEDRGIARNLANVVEVSTDNLKQNKRNATLAATLVAEGAAVLDDKMTFTQIAHVIKKFGVTSVSSSELIEDNIAFLINQTIMQIAEAFVKLEDDQFCQSLSGLDSTSFTGIMSNPTLTNMSSTNTAFTDLAYANLLSCLGGAKSKEAVNARWFMNRSVWYSAILSLVDAKNYPVAQEGANGMMLLGHPVTLSDSLIGTTAVSTKFIAFGNPEYITFAD